VNDDLLPGHADLDAALDSARREQIRRLAATLDLDGGLDAILPRAARVGHDPATTTMTAARVPGRVAPTLLDGEAALLIMIRVRVRSLALSLSLAIQIVRTHDLGRTLNLSFDVARNLAGILDLARARADDLDRDLDSSRLRDLFPARARELARHIDRASARDRDDAHALASATRRGRRNPRARTRDRDLALDLYGRLHATHGWAKQLSSQVNAVVIDASGADLSSLDLPDVSVLEGVVWTEETTWPAGVLGEVRAQSEMIRDGVYQVRGGTEREPAGLVSN
jgi:hypothetical protein